MERLFRVQGKVGLVVGGSMFFESDKQWNRIGCERDKNNTEMRDTFHVN